jgi:hypothetical protein
LDGNSKSGLTINSVELKMKSTFNHDNRIIQEQEEITIRGIQRHNS